MLWLTCPNCGRRPIEEFAFGGEVRAVPEWITDADTREVDLVWMVGNVEGATSERWFHAAGCRRWTTVRRDTARDAELA